MVVAFGPDGNVRDQFETKMAQPSWFWENPDGSITVSGLDCRRGELLFAGREDYSRGGSLQRRRPGWLTPLRLGPPSVESIGGWTKGGVFFEVLVHRPFARLLQREAEEPVTFSCSELPASLRDLASKGLPWLRPEEPQRSDDLFTVAAATGPDGELFVLANGSVILSVDTKSTAVECARLAAADVPKGSVPVGLAVTENHAAVAFQAPDNRSFMRLWATKAGR